jgi:hypothetical protein
MADPRLRPGIRCALSSSAAAARPRGRAGLAALVLTLFAGVLVPGAARATDGAVVDDLPNDELVCPVDDPALDVVARLRAVSLDLRGTPPSPEEVAAFDGLDDDAAAVLEATLIDEWLASPEFGARVVRRHRTLLWPNLTPIEFSTRGIVADARGIYSRNDGGVQQQYRGLRGATCRDEPARFDADGTILTTPVDGANVEGFVLVRPYWDPTTEVKVCAFDAEDALVDDAGVDCAAEAGTGRPGCGCGPNLQWCLRTEDQQAVRAALLEDVDRRIAANVEGDESYLELLTGRRAFVNGVLAHYWRNLTKLPRFVRMEPAAVDVATLPPDLAFPAAGDWRAIELDDSHAGVLTSPAYLLRFQSDRARANRFYNAFLCQPFQPPAGGIAITASTEPDLQVREGCKYCHAVLEPAAAHWGRFTEYGAGHLSSALYPPVRDDCRRCALNGSGCSDDCNRFYLTRAQTEEERAWLGSFRPYVFRDDEHVRNVESGPRLLVLASVVDGRLQRCVARSTAEWLLGRPLGDDDAAAVDDFVRGFEDDGFRYRALVKRIVQSDLYRRVR